MPRLVAVVLLVAAPAIAPAQVAPADSFLVVEGDTLFVAPPIEVVGGRVPAALPGALRPVRTTTDDELDRQPSPAIADALNLEPSVIASQRQRLGVQADLSLRGSTFEQVQLLLDGFDVSDPQTGHHALNLPLGLHDVARIEVMPGHGSVLLGDGAFGGTVNVVPARPTAGAGGRVAVRGGSHAAWAVSGSLNVPLDGGRASQLAADSPIGSAGRGLRVSAERMRTDGHEVDGEWSGRDAEHAISTLRFLDATLGRTTDVFVGHAHRAFGARGFYTPTFAHETTRALVATARHRRQFDDVVVEARLAGRRHRDEFVLDRADPDRYRNDHLTRRLLGGLRLAVPVAGAWTLAADLEGAYEDIDSDGIRDGAAGDALGEHVRRRASLALELSRSLAPVRLLVGGRLDLRDRREPRLDGSATVAVQPRPALALHVTAGTVSRMPSFTELYYADPYNRGDPGLGPEVGWSWEVGGRHDDGTWRLAAAFFARHEDDLVDWVRAAADTVWRARNVADGYVRGVEVRGGWRHPRGHRLELGWQNLHQERSLPAGAEARAALVTPRQHVTGAATAVLPAGFDATLIGRYVHRTGGHADFRVAAVFDARLRWRRGAWTVAVDGLNLLDRRYSDVPATGDAPGPVLPGRTWIVGVALRY